MKLLSLRLCLALLLFTGLSTNAYAQKINSGSLTSASGSASEVICNLPSDAASGTFSVTGTYVGTITLKVLVGDSAGSWLAKDVFTDTDDSSQVSVLAGNATNKILVFTNTGFRAVKAQMTSYTSGTADIWCSKGVGSGSNASAEITGDVTIGDVVLGAGSAQIGHLESNQSVDVTKINSVAPLMGAGNTGTGSLRVTEATNSALTAAALAVQAAVETLSGIVTSSRAATNIIVGQTGIAAGAGAVGATVPRFTLASDDPLVSTITSSRVAVNPISGQAGVAAGAGNISALTQRFTIASDDPLYLAATGTSTPYLADAFDETVETIDSNAGVLDGYFCYNPNAEVIFVQIFNISGSVTLGTSVPLLSLGIPSESSGNLTGMNISFGTAIKAAATTTPKGSTPPTTDLNCNFWSH